VSAGGEPPDGPVIHVASVQSVDIGAIDEMFPGTPARFFVRLMTLKTDFGTLLISLQADAEEKLYVPPEP
jgi:hypothetical protein